MLVLLLSSLASAGDLDATIDEALVVHLSAQGLARLGDAVEGLVPTAIPVEGASDVLDCTEDTTLTWDLQPLEVQLSADDVALVPSAGRLDLTLYGTLGSTEASLHVTGDCAILTDLDQQCTLQLPTTAIEAHVGIAMSWDGAAVDATVDDVTLFISPITNPIHDCTLFGAVGALLTSDPAFVSGLVAEQVQPTLDDLPATIEEAIEGALDGIAFDTEVDLLGAPLGIALSPTRFELDDTGLILGLGAKLTGGDASRCVNASAGFEPTGDGWPPLDGVAAGSSLPYDAGVLFSRDFVDRLLWTTWAAGALCMDLEEFNGIALTTGLTAPLFDERLTEYLGEGAPTPIKVRPGRAPRFVFDEDSPPLALDLDGLGVLLEGEMVNRKLRVLQIDVATRVGLDVTMTDNVLRTAILVDPDDLDMTESFGRLVRPGYSAGLPSLITPLLDGLLPTDVVPEVALPAPLGIGIGPLFWQPTPDDQWQGLYLLLETDAVQPIAIGGCSAEGIGCEGDGPTLDLDLESALGCNDPATVSGCENTGCGVVRVPVARLIPLLLAGLVVRRRRRTERG